MRTVLVVIGTRPEAIKLAPVVHALTAHPNEFRTVVCLTGQHRELVDDLVEPLNLHVDHDLDVMRPGQSVTDVALGILAGFPAVLEAERPDLVLVQGDTVSATTAALAAFYAHVPVGHVEAGLRTGQLDEPFPEEGNRRIIAAMSTLHFAPTEWAADNLRREGIAESTITITGNTGIDSFRYVSARMSPEVPEVLRELPWKDRQLVLVTVHRRENQSEHLPRICEAVRQIANEPGVHVVFPMHPSPAVRRVVTRLLGDNPQVSLLEPLNYVSMVWLLHACRIVLTDSGGLQEEAAAAGRPVLVLRRNTDRPEAVQHGSAVLVGSDVADIVSWTTQLVRDEVSREALSHQTDVYGDGHAAERIVMHLRSEGRPRVIDLTQPLDTAPHSSVS